MSRSRRILVFVAALVVLVTGAAVAAMFTPASRYITWGWQRITGGATVGERVDQYGPAARARLWIHFDNASTPYPPKAVTLIALKDIRQLEVWVDHCDHAHDPSQPCDNPPTYIRSYPILAASGVAGPKLREGDGQVPEGIYAIESLNPNSLFHLALRVNYPNEADKAQARIDGRDKLGGDIMIHGSDASVGCLAMGDPAIEELFVLAAETGIERIRLIITPTDSRPGGRWPKPILLNDQPQWVVDRYVEITRAMQSYARPAAQFEVVEE